MLIAGSDTRIVELRVHGFSGTSAESLVDAVAAVDVAGDGVGRLVRPADRLRRPAPGQVLTTAGRSVPRTVEGYLWGSMTSGGLAKATWALLLPFALANVAHWMLPPLAPDRTAGRVLGLLLRALLRTVSLLLTCLLVAQITLLSLDLVAAQCLAPDAACLPGMVPGWVRGEPLARAAVGLLPVAALAWLLHRVSGTDWTAPEPGPGTSTGAGPSSPGPGLPATPLAGDPDTPMLRALHTTAALATAALLALGGPSGAVTVAWVIAVALLAVTVGGGVLLDDPTGASAHRGGHWPRTVLGRWQRRLLIATAGGVLVAAAALVPMPDTAATLPGTGDTIGSITALLGVLVGLIAVLLVAAARVARPAWAALPRRLRPWAGGWAAAPVVALAVLVGAGFGASAALTLRRLLGRPDLELPAGYSAVTLVWGAGGALLIVGAAVTAAVLALRHWQLTLGRTAAPAEVPMLHPTPSEQAAVTPAWWRAGLMRDHVHHVVLAAVAVLVTLWIAQLVAAPLPGWTRPAGAFGVFVLISLAGAVLGAVYRAARRPDAARRLGMLWDLISFWPREAHPTVPPCYPLKVVPELVRRAREHLADPRTRVVLSGHSQGSLLAAVATARLLADLPPPDRERVGLLTAGSQLQWAYARAFPSVVPHSCLAALSGALDGRWRSLCRGTDPVGGGVTTWRRQAFEGSLLGIGFRADGSEGALAPATLGPHGALVLGGDHWLPDPARAPIHGRRWRAGILGHGDYLADPEWDRAVAMAAGIVPVDTHRPGGVGGVPGSGGHVGVGGVGVGVGVGGVGVGVGGVGVGGGERGVGSGVGGTGVGVVHGAGVAGHQVGGNGVGGPRVSGGVQVGIGAAGDGYAVGNGSTNGLGRSPFGGSDHPAPAWPPEPPDQPDPPGRPSTRAPDDHSDQGPL